MQVARVIRLSLLVAVLGCSLAGPSAAAVDGGTVTIESTIPRRYPVPPASEKRLFYLQRSSNSNTVVYDANLRADGTLDPRHPVEVYWIRYASSGKKKKLGFLERNFAYGVNSERVDEAPGGYRVQIVAFDRRKFHVYVDARGKVQAVTRIHGRAARLEVIYLQLKGKGAMPEILHIDLFGHDIASGQPVHERIIP